MLFRSNQPNPWMQQGSPLPPPSSGPGYPYGGQPAPRPTPGPSRPPHRPYRAALVGGLVGALVSAGVAFATVKLTDSNQTKVVTVAQAPAKAATASATSTAKPATAARHGSARSFGWLVRFGI